MFLNKLTNKEAKELIYEFLGKTMLNPDSELSVSYDYYDRNDEMLVSKRKDCIDLCWGRRTITFYDYSIHAASLSFQNEAVKEKLNEEWMDFMESKFGKEYADSCTKVPKDGKTLS